MAVDFAEEAVDGVAESRTRLLAEGRVAPDQPVGHQQVVAQKTAVVTLGRQAAHGADAGPGDRQPRGGRHDIEYLQNFRGKRHQMKILDGGEARELRLQNPPLLRDVSKRFKFQFNHQVHVATESAHHLVEGRDQRTGASQVREIGLPDGDGPPEQAPGIRIVTHHGPPVAGPAHVELDAPAAAVDRGLEGGQRVFEDSPIVMLAAMGDDPALRQAPGRRPGLRITPKEGIRAAQKGVFEPGRNGHVTPRGQPPIEGAPIRTPAILELTPGGSTEYKIAMKTRSVKPDDPLDKKEARADWEKLTVPPAQAIAELAPGMSVFIGTGVAEPRTLMKHVMGAEATHLQDLELIQLVSLGDAISLEALGTHRYRLKTFYSGWAASEAIGAGQIDLIPSRFSEIPHLIASGRILIDAALIQITPPNADGYCSFGMAVDVARLALDRARVKIGEINAHVPVTLGDTLVHVSEFNHLVRSTETPIYFSRWPVDDVFDRVAAHVAAVIEDGSCLAFSIGPLYEALGRQLVHKRHLGLHTPFFTDAVMDLVKSGAVTNRHKEIFRGKSLTSYAFGTRELMTWLDRNPLVEFQQLDKVFAPKLIGQNPRFVGILPARKVDLSGRIVMHVGKGNVTAGPGDVMDLLHGAELSAGGLRLFALPSRNLRGEANIRPQVDDFPNQLNVRESVDMVITEYGVASLSGRSVRERAQALIEVAHPADRLNLIEAAKAMNILYPDQIFIAASAHLYPAHLRAERTFKGGVAVRFRAIKPSDEDGMRRLFYRFSDEAVYYRYFTPVKTMPHAKTQKYVNIDYAQTLSVVGLVGDPGAGRIIAEARFVKDPLHPVADVAFVVDEAYQGLGIGTYLFNLLVRLAAERGLRGFTADVLATNTAMMKVFEKSGLAIKANLEDGIYSLSISFDRHLADAPSGPA